ncbi:MAG TPA: hypothetical protein VMI13_10890 [Solirubrobacteraceae bacterium]|nr:hypothetical protein [Solirubrobacteraceae bacterium]
MKRIQMLVASLLITGSCLAALAATPVAASAATIEVRETSRGKILVDEAGFTLYVFTADKKHQDHCITIEENGVKCSTAWPPLEVTEAPTVGPGLKHPNRISTTTLPGGAKQVTFKKKPLYTYIGDFMPGQVNYIGALAFGGFWYGISARGMMVR